MVIQLIYRQRPNAEIKPVELPLSKSIALRVLALNAVSCRCGGGEAYVPKLPDASDVAGMLRGIRLYDYESGNTAQEISDRGYTRNVVNIGEGGATLRFFTAFVASTPGVDITVTTHSSLMRRPFKPLLDVLRTAGADLHCLRHEGYPPLRIIGRKLSPGPLALDPSVSSQFVSALMMASPLWGNGLDLTFKGCVPVSAPYIRMTAEIMRRFGAEVEASDNGIRVKSGRLTAPAEFPVETDWSAASYFYELALLSPGREVPLRRLTPSAGSLQGDARCESIFGLLGIDTVYQSDGSAILRCNPEKLDVFRSIDTPLELDLNATPDLVPALAVGFCLAGIKFRFTGIGHLRHKETNRMTALANELERIGYRLVISDDSMAWEGDRTPSGENETIETYNDHRMAMAFAPAAVVLPYVSIDSPDVVEKSFPGYWEALKGLGFEISLFGGSYKGRYNHK